MDVKNKILITGAGGMLGGMVAQKAAQREDYAVSAYTSKELNICDRLMVDDIIKAVKPDWIVNCAAYAKIDASETHREEALRANIHGPQVLGELALEHNCKVLHVSSGLVFDGGGDKPYTEDDLTAPETIYGKTKRLGELALWKVLPEAIVVRSSRLYGPGGRNFVNDMLKAAVEKEEVNVVSDQVGSPTFTGDMAGCIFNLIDNDAKGLYHYASAGQCSWYEFAEAILAEAQNLGVTVKLIRLTPILGLYYHTQAKRPMYSALDSSKYKALPNADVPHWHESLKHYMQNYLEIEQGQIVSAL